MVGIARISDVSLLDRLRNAADWLEHLWQSLLRDRAPPIVMPGLDLAVRLIDATTISSPRSPTAEWRLHMDYRPQEGRFGGALLTDARQAEGFHHFTAGPGELVVGDRGYAKAAGLKAIHVQGGHFLVRTGWRSLVLQDKNGDDFNILDTISKLSSGKISTFDVQIAESARNRRPVCGARLLFSPLPEGAGERAHRKAKDKAKRSKKGILPQSAQAANWLMLLTTVPEEKATPEQLVALYRLRWQIELAFKRMKSQMHIDELVAKDQRLARSWIAANLIAALLADDIDMSPDSSPCAAG
jgi:hypothetical protein